jgi:hypothetical protein
MTTPATMARLKPMDTTIRIPMLMAAIATTIITITGRIRSLMAATMPMITIMITTTMTMNIMMIMIITMTILLPSTLRARRSIMALVSPGCMSPA